MNAKKLIAASTLALLSGAAVADGATIVQETFVPTRSRAEVKAEVVKARIAGQLVPAGEGPGVALSLSSNQSRAALRADVLQARASGELIAAGEGPVAEDAPFVSTLSRAQVKSEVLQARAEGRLIPAGEGVYGNASIENGPGRASSSYATLWRFNRTQAR